MFTGIVDHCGKIKSIARHANQSIQLEIATQFSDLILGESIAVNGICLTVAEVQGSDFICELSPETLKMTTANHFHQQQTVNLERALRMSDRFGGHFVLGHVDGIAKVVSRIDNTEFCQLTFMISSTISAEMSDYQSYVLPKGSITIDGVSLTINDYVNHQLSVMLIPHTLERTTLSQLSTHAEVNIEFDYLAKIVAAQTNVSTKLSMKEV